MNLEQQVVSKTEMRTLRGGGYHAIHKWLVKHFGKADHCENNNCTGKSKMFVWAKKPDKEYEHRLDSFVQLCQSCHMKQDRTVKWTKNNADAKRGKLHTQEHRKKIALAMKGKNLGNQNARKVVR